MASAKTYTIDVWSYETHRAFKNRWALKQEYPYLAEKSVYKFYALYLNYPNSWYRDYASHGILCVSNDSSGKVVTPAPKNWILCSLN